MNNYQQTGSAKEAVRYLSTIFEDPKPSFYDWLALYGLTGTEENWQNTFMLHLTGRADSTDHRVSREFRELTETELLRLSTIIPSLIETTFQIK